MKKLMLFLLVGMFMLSFASAVHTTALSYWSLNESTGSNADDYRANRDGTLNNMENGDWVSSGGIGNSLQFGGTDEYVNIPDNAAWDGTAFTISLWVKSSIFGGDEVFLDRYYTDGVQGYYIRKSSATGFIDFLVDSDAGAVTISTSALPSVDEWHHIVGRWDGARMTMWMDGVEEADTKAQTGTVTSANPISLGRAGDSSWYYTGHLDEVGIWNSNLTNTQVLELYAGNAPQAEAPVIIVNSLANNSRLLIDKPGNFSVNITPEDDIIHSSGLVNATLRTWYANGSLYNWSRNDLSGVASIETNFNLTFPHFANYTWNVASCQGDGAVTNCSTTINRTFETSAFQTDTQAYNTSTAETANEKFSMNITLGGGYTLTSATLVYNTTSYTTSITNHVGTEWNVSRSINIPIEVTNNSFYFSFLVNGSTYLSDVFGQEVNETIFTLCNTTWATQFLNITFKDESDLSNTNASIPTSTFTYWLGDGSVNKSYTYVNASNNQNYEFCASPNRTMSVDSRIQYKQGTLYPQRIYDPGVLSYTNTLTTKILYLLSTIDGIYVTFQVVNPADQVLEGVLINATRLISGAQTIVGTGFTGASGTLTMWLNPDFTHNFVFSKALYTPFITSFAPTQTQYTVVLGPTTSNSTDDYYQGISYNYGPPVATLVNDTTYNFYFNLSSTHWTVENFGFELTNSSGTSLGAIHLATNGGDAVLNYDAGNNSNIIMNYFWTINGTNSTGTVTWMVLNSEATEFGLGNFFTNLNTHVSSGLFGMGPFGLALLVFMIIFISVGLVSWKFGITNTFSISLMLFVLIALFDSLSLLDGMNPTGVNRFPTMFMGLISVAFLIREATR